MIDLKQFCAKCDVLKFIERPFVVDGYRIATNRYVLVRVPTKGKNTAGAADRFIEFYRAMFAVDPDPAGWAPMPALPAPSACETCGGIGAIDDESPDDKDCFDCDGTGEADAPIQIGPAMFNARIIREVADLPNVWINVSTEEGPAAVRFDGGDGLAMPVSKGPK